MHTDEDIHIVYVCADTANNLGFAASALAKAPGAPCETTNEREHSSSHHIEVSFGGKDFVYKTV